ncbi:MAG TPA: methyltransferase domain-containing protein [Solirubrobacterales bacterium]|jgi:SAM-dependent methyltransferase
MELAPFVVCPETLGPLEARDDGYWSPRAGRLYPVREGLVFMAYPRRDAAMIAETMEEEHDWQGTADVAARNLEYVRANAPRAVDFINLVRPLVEANGRRPRALELGCGNGWVSWLLAEAGFETWMCDFESNSLATGLNLEHPNIGDGRRFVVDARYPPIADGSMDLVVFKEFVHHVSDHRSLFREANRVLRKGGLMALMEPVRSARQAIYEIRHPDPHQGHHLTSARDYLRSIRGAGFEIARQAYVYGERAGQGPLAARIRDRAVSAIDPARPTGDWFTRLHFRLIGGAQLIVLARKTRDVQPLERPQMTPISPDNLDLESQDLRPYDEFPTVLGEAAARLE